MTDTPWLDCMDGFKYSQEDDAAILDKAALKVSQILRISVGEIDKTKFVYLYTLLYTNMGQGKDGDDNMRHWMNTHNTHLGFCPADSLTDEESLAMMTEYLEHFANI